MRTFWVRVPPFLARLSAQAGFQTLELEEEVNRSRQQSSEDDRC